MEQATSSKQGGPRTVLVFGGPGAGKGTQASLLASKLGVPHVSSGELLRQREHGQAQSVMDRGELLPDDVVADVVYQRLQQPDARGGAILDGFPRTLEQARLLDAWLEQRGDGIRAAVYLDVPRDVLVERMLARGRLSGRHDDNPNAADTRVAVFMDALPPVLEHYAARDVLRRVDGTPAVDDVHRGVVRALGDVESTD